MESIDKFLQALGLQESSGDYKALNKDSGASGLFQILPDNWESWSIEYFGYGGVSPTIENQYIVAKFKAQQYFDMFGNWEDVAKAWYAGEGFKKYTNEQQNKSIDSRGNFSDSGEYPSIQGYANSVLGKMGFFSTEKILKADGEKSMFDKLKETAGKIIYPFSQEFVNKTMKTGLFIIYGIILFVVGIWLLTKDKTITLVKEGK
jgi:hypothetical protein